MDVNKTALAKAVIQQNPHLAKTDLASLERAVAPFVDDVQQAIKAGKTTYTLPV